MAWPCERAASLAGAHEASAEGIRIRLVEVDYGPAGDHTRQNGVGVSYHEEMAEVPP